VSGVEAGQAGHLAFLRIGMDKVREFRQRARECRVSAARAASSELKGHYEQLADIWEKLADERLAFFIDNPDKQITEAATGS
jgi:hypothetical protein